MKKKSKKNRKIVRCGSLFGGILLLLAGILAGCGASDSSKASYQAAVAEEAAAADYQYASETTLGSDAYYDYDEGGWEMKEEAEEALKTDSPEVKDNSRKLIRNVNLDVETEAFDEMLAIVAKKTEAFGGYIEESYTYNGSAYYGRKTRNANMTIRIPSQSFDDFLSTVSAVSNVISRNESVTDVTLQYVDMDSHKKALQAEQERLLKLMEQVETIEDIIALESRLSEVRYQIESMESQLRTLDNQVSYSTLYLQVKEVEKLTPVKEQTIWEKMATGFASSLYGVGSDLLNFCIGIVINLPYLVIWAVIIFLLVFFIRKIVKHRRNRRQRKEEKKAERDQEKKAEKNEESIKHE